MSTGRNARRRATKNALKKQEHISASQERISTKRTFRQEKRDYRRILERLEERKV